MVENSTTEHLTDTENDANIVDTPVMADVEGTTNVTGSQSSSDSEDKTCEFSHPRLGMREDDVEKERNEDDVEEERNENDEEAERVEDDEDEETKAKRIQLGVYSDYFWRKGINMRDITDPLPAMPTESEMEEKKRKRNVIMSNIPYNETDDEIFETRNEEKKCLESFGSGEDDAIGEKLYSEFHWEHMVYRKNLLSKELLKLKESKKERLEEQMKNGVDYTEIYEELPEDSLKRIEQLKVIEDLRRWDRFVAEHGRTDHEHALYHCSDDIEFRSRRSDQSDDDDDDDEGRSRSRSRSSSPRRRRRAKKPIPPRLIFDSSDIADDFLSKPADDTQYDEIEVERNYQNLAKIVEDRCDHVEALKRFLNLRIPTHRRHIYRNKRIINDTAGLASLLDELRRSYEKAARAGSLADDHALRCAKKLLEIGEVDLVKKVKKILKREHAVKREETCDDRMEKMETQEHETTRWRRQDKKNHARDYEDYKNCLEIARIKYTHDADDEKDDMVDTKSSKTKMRVQKRISKEKRDAELEEYELPSQAVMHYYSENRRNFRTSVYYLDRDMLNRLSENEKTDDEENYVVYRRCREEKRERKTKKQRNLIHSMRWRTCKYEENKHRDGDEVITNEDHSDYEEDLMREELAEYGSKFLKESYETDILKNKPFLTVQIDTTPSDFKPSQMLEKAMQNKIFFTPDNVTSWESLKFYRKHLRVDYKYHSYYDHIASLNSGYRVMEKFMTFAEYEEYEAKKKKKSDDIKQKKINEKKAKKEFALRLEEEDKIRQSMRNSGVDVPIGHICGTFPNLIPADAYPETLEKKPLPSLEEFGKGRIPFSHDLRQRLQPSQQRYKIVEAIIARKRKLPKDETEESGESEAKKPKYAPHEKVRWIM